MFPVRTVKQVYTSDAAISEEMLRRITMWEQMYSGKAPWISDDIISLGTEQAIVRELANITLGEMTAAVTNKKLDGIFQMAIENLNINMQKALAMGAFVVKPLGIGSDKVQYVPQGSFIPMEYDVNGRLTKVIFPEIKCLSEREYLIRLEHHSLDMNGLTITNRAFRSSSPDTLGKEISLSSVPEWAGMTEAVRYPKMLRPAFGYYVNPIANTVDGSHAGVSVFDKAVHVIRKADIQFGRLDWEFESGERAIHADAAALRLSESGEYRLPDTKKKLYRGLNIDNGTEELFKEYSPILRQDNFIAGLEEYKRTIEFIVGLSYGDLSNPQFVEKTATEVKSARKRKYNTVSAIQNNLKTCLDDLVYALAFYNGLTLSGYEFICDFKDSILMDEETEREQDRKDLANGTLRPEEYRSKWRGETLEQAVKNLPKAAEVIE
ncbi:MAG: phage capsid protein [Ruminococcus sp.]|nr:phage capsid protein [Ruminococcus sp.]